MFHLMPYRDLPDDFQQRYKSAFIDPLWFDVADSEKVGPVLQRHPRRTAARGESWVPRALYQSASPECLRLHGQSELDGFGSGQGDQWPEHRHHSARLDAALHVAAHAYRRGIRDARLHQRWTAHRRLSHGVTHGRHDL